MVNALEIATKFHEAYERLAPSFGYETRKETRAFDANTPNGRLMQAVCQEIGDQIEKSGYNAGFKTAIDVLEQLEDKIANDR
jgi:hypothetical protein